MITKVITFSQAPKYVNGTTKIQAKIKFDLLYGTTDLSPRSVRVLYPALLGNYELKAWSGKETASTTMKLNVYDSYLTYDELKPEIDKITTEAKDGRYIGYQSIGKSVENRDVHFVVLAKDKASVDQYLNEIAPLKVDNPAELQKKLKDGSLEDYKIPVWFNNIHPDEAQGVDAIVELFRLFATENEVAYKTTDAKGVEQTITIPVEEALDNLIFLFNFTQNPDGRVHNLRRNVNDFDLNRDNAYQTQIETQIMAQTMSKWLPISMIDFHGYYKEFVIEPCTPPHNPNYEYDLLMDGMIEQAHAMGKAGVSNTKYDSYLIPLEGWEDKFDDATPSYTSTYSMFLGALGHTVEIPDLNQESYHALVYTGLAAVKYNMDHKEKLFNNQLEIYKRGVSSEDNTKVDQWLINAKREVIGRDRVEGQNFFPEYYVLPVDQKLQKNPLEAHKMVEYLLRNGVKVEQSTEAVTVGNVTYPAGSYVVAMNQALRGFVNTALFNGTDVSDWAEMYAEIVLNFHHLRGFDRAEIRTEGAFAGKTSKVEKVVLPQTTVPGQATSYVIKNTNNDAIKAVNQLLNAAKSVSITEDNGTGYEYGDFVVSAVDLHAVKDAFYLQVVPFDNLGKTRELKQVKVANVGSGQTKFVLEQLGFTLVKSSKDADVIVDDAGKVKKDDLASGKAYIGIGKSALENVTKQNLLPGFKYSQTAGSRANHEGLVKANIIQNSVITGPYNNNELLYVATGSWITQVPEGARALAKVSTDKDFYLAGWWPGNEGLKGQTLAITNGQITLFANDVTHKAHNQFAYRMLAGAIFQ
ncbi:M14 family metallopeptidase [Ammoniphilus sp. CFH 90114]|uniref:M14 family metallopeptidase n=1 Tax=Ammoniphilus sp. CFH 90114 TaxID=2493665 RepID=UPI0013E980EE|nr:M14 family zinc carboxypeptidase [Ammoniphilus sp. CFH 90114]